MLICEGSNKVHRMALSSTIRKEEPSGNRDKTNRRCKARPGDTRVDMLQRPLSRSPVARHAVPFAVRSTAGARHEAARNGSDQSLAIRWLWEQGMGWLGTPRPLPALVTGLADCGTTSRNRLVNAAAPNLGSQPRRTYDGIAGVYLDLSARNSCCCCSTFRQHRTTFPSIFSTSAVSRVLHARESIYARHHTSIAHTKLVHTHRTRAL